MTYNKKSIEDIEIVEGARVLVRCDFNVPLKDGVITNDKRIVASLPTIKYLLDNGAKVILCSHLGKPKGEPKPELSLAPVAAKLSELLGQEVKFAADAEVVGLFLRRRNFRVIPAQQGIGLIGKGKNQIRFLLSGTLILVNHGNTIKQMSCIHHKSSHCN